MLGNSLKTKIIFQVIVTLLTCFLIGSGFYYFHTKKKQALFIKNKARKLVEQLSISLREPLWNVDEDLTKELILSEMTDKDIYGILVFDEKGKLFVGIVRDASWNLKEFQGNRLPNGQDLITARHSIRILIDREEKLLGSAEVFLSPKFLNQSLNRRILITVTQFGCLTIVVAILLLIIMEKVILQRIDKLVEGVSFVANRDFSHKLPDLGNDEIGFLADQYNFMLNRLVKYEKELNQRIKRWEVTLRSIGDGVIVTDKVGKITLMNEVACILTGWNEDDAMGRSLDDVFHIINEFSREPVRSPVKKVMESGKIVGLANHTLLISKDGREIPIKDSAAPIKDEDGNLLGIVLVFTDISVEVDLLKKIENSAMIERGLVEVANVLVAITDRKGRLLFWNRAAERITGYLREDILGKDVGWSLIYPDKVYRDKMLERVEEVMTKGRSIQGEESRVTTKNGEKKIISWYSVALIQRDRKAIGCLHVGIDITEKKRLEKEVLKNKTMEALSFFAGGIAHDFNNILTGILGNVSLLKHTESLVKVRERLDLLEKGVYKASSLVSQLLSFSQKGVPVKEVTSLETLLRESIEFVLTGSSIKCELDIETPLWEVEVNPVQISQIIQNIVINAIQASEGISKKIQVSAKNVCFDSKKTVGDKTISPGRYVEISVIDQGVGIHPKNLKRIFDPFFTTKETGHGLGLAICYSIIKSHQGEIVVESELGRGTKFRIFIPALLEGKSLSNKKSQESKKDYVFSGRVLVLEDDEMIGEISKELLKSLGFEDVVVVREGLAAVKEYKDAKGKGQGFKLVIVDLTIAGGMGGKDSMNEILKIDPQAIGIVSSGYITDPVMVNYEKYGFKGVLKKPYTFGEMKKVISSVLSLDS